MSDGQNIVAVASLDDLLSDGCYQVIRSRRRSVELRVYPDRRIEVRAPLRMPQKDIDAFVLQRQAWLLKRLETFSHVQPMLPPPSDAQRFVTGSEHPYLGERIQLTLRKGRGGARLDDNVLHMPVADVDNAMTVEKALARWYRAQAQDDFSQRLHRWFTHFEKRGHTLPALTLRTMRSRWGSLSSRTGMTLNVELIKTPPACIDYVVLHELCHLEHMNHGPHFKALMSEYMPDWRARKATLNATPLR